MPSCRKPSSFYIENRKVTDCNCLPCLFSPSVVDFLALFVRCCQEFWRTSVPQLQKDFDVPQRNPWEWLLPSFWIAEVCSSPHGQAKKSIWTKEQYHHQLTEFIWKIFYSHRKFFGQVMKEPKSSFFFALRNWSGKRSPTQILLVVYHLNFCWTTWGNTVTGMQK